MSCVNGPNPLLPQICRITDIREETPDTKCVYVQTLAGRKPFTPLPGQMAMLSLPGVGEAVFSVAGQGEDYLCFAVKRRGELTEALHEAWPGQHIGLRGPYGNHFPLEEAKGRDLLFISGGVGLAPLRSFISYALDNRADYGAIEIVYGAHTPQELLFKRELLDTWPGAPRTRTYVTVDAAAGQWPGPVGLVPSYVRQLAFAPLNRLAVVCGPPAMIRLTVEALTELGFAAEQIITTLERRMKCGIGSCGRCNIGGKYVCLEGPVFSLAQLRDLAPESVYGN